MEADMWGINEGDEVVRYLDTDIEQLLEEYAVCEGLEPGNYTIEITKGRKLELASFIPSFKDIEDAIDERIASEAPIDDTLISLRESAEDTEDAWTDMFMSFAEEYLKFSDYWLFDGEIRKKVNYDVVQKSEDEIEVKLNN